MGHNHPPPNFEAPRVLLAPMAGVTDLPYRQRAVSLGAPYVVSEMIASDQLAHARPDTIRRAARAAGPAPFVIQLAGREERWMARGAELAEAAGADVVDINLGCPAKRVTSGACGAALMRDPDRALKLIDAAVRATSKPVTVKLRLGWCASTLNAPEIAKRAEQAGVRMITVHARTRQQFYAGRADWRAIRATVEAVRLPVIANGDIADLQDARAALRASGAHGVMIGRAAHGRPWLVGAVAKALASGAGQVVRPPYSALLDALIGLYEDTLAFYGPTLGLRIARKHLAWSIETELTELDPMTRRATRARICRIEEPSAVVELLREIFGAHEERLAA